MNTANLQIEGLLTAVAALTDMLRRKGYASGEEIDAALEQAETAARGDHLRPEELSESNVKAVLFPIRFLREANRQADAGTAAFSDTAMSVGHALRKPPIQE